MFLLGKKLVLVLREELGKRLEGSPVKLISLGVKHAHEFPIAGKRFWNNNFIHKMGFAEYIKKKLKRKRI